MIPRANFPRLVHSVQRNCHIADAHHAREMTLCNYLLEMREFYRWEHALPPAQALPRQDLGDWISAREALWDAMQRRETFATTGTRMTLRFFGGFDFSHETGHLAPGPSVEDSHRLRAEPKRRPRRVHGGVAAPDDDDIAAERWRVGPRQ